MPPNVIQHRGEDLLVFELAGDYARNNAAVGYWGEVTSSIDWCERNYVVSFFVAEFFNTLSNLAFVACGLCGVYMAARMGLERRFVICHCGIALIGTGSALFHGTLSHLGQQWDETPMVLATSNWLLTLYFMDPRLEARSPGIHRRCAWVLATCCVAWGALHFVYRFTVAFQVGIAVLLLTGVGLLSREWPKCEDPAVLKVGREYYLTTAGLAFVLWLCDQHFCVHLHSLPGGLHNPQFHAWWHILMGINGYLGPTFLAYQRECYLGKRPRMRWAGGLVPFVDTTDSSR